jgi:integrase
MTDTSKYAFSKARDARGHEIRGLWERNGRYYASMRYPGRKSASMVPLVGEDNQAVQTVAQAVLARGRLAQDRMKGKTPAPRITPPFDEYCKHYLDWLETTEAKSKLTVARERSALKHCAKYFGCLRLSAVTAANIDNYILERKREEVHSRSLNIQIIALRNLFNFAKRQGALKHELPTAHVKQLPYKAQKRSLLPRESLNALCAEATRKNPDQEVELILRIQNDYRKLDSNGARNGATDWQKAWAEHPQWKTELRADTDGGRQALYSRANYLATHPDAAKPQPVYAQGEVLADWIKLMAYSGARRTAALQARWEHVDWRNRQLHLFTKRDKEVVVDFSPKLEGHLKDMHARRVPMDERGTLSPFLFPSSRPGDSSLGHMTNFQKTLDAVRRKINLPNFNPHDLRHYFISMCVMEGFDFMTIAEWVGHSDGGVLIGRVYGHLNPGHKRALAERLTFGEKPAEPKPVAPAPSSMDLSKLSVADLLKLVQGMAEGATPRSPSAPGVAQP